MNGLEPRGMFDMTGWHELTCEQADIIMDRHRDLPTFVVASGASDTDSSSYFREWWFNDAPLLREYRNLGECSHFGAVDSTAAAEVTA